MSARTIFQMDTARADGYPVLWVDDAFDDEWFGRAAAGASLLLVTTPTVERLYRARIAAAVGRSGGRAAVLTIPSGEPAKTLAAVEAICEHALGLGLERDGILAALGGGVCSDLVTMAASVYRRGVRHVRIPTTLVGQVDAGISLKGAVNSAGRKSALGCFHAPAEVRIDPTMLATLPAEEIRAGLAEVLKMAVIGDPVLFDLVAQSWPVLIESRFQRPEAVAPAVIERSARRMLEAIADNPFEDRTYERTVDAGHIFSPRLEAVSGFRIRHGEAVAIDLALSATVAARLGLLSNEHRDRIVGTLAAMGLPVYSPNLTEQLCSAALDDAARHRGGRINLPVPTRVGGAAFLRERADLPPAVLASALAQLRRDALALQ